MANDSLSDAAVLPTRKELAGKYLGHTKTRIEKRRKNGPWFMQWYLKFFYDGRPDVAAHKTRAHHWEELHSSWRFIQALFCYFGPPGHLLRNLALPFGMVTAVALGCATYYGMQATKSPFLPSFDSAGNLKTLFQLGSFAVSLLLAMRLNRVYERWWLARQSFGSIGLHTIQAAHWMAVWCKDEALVQKFMNWLIVYHYAVIRLMLALPKMPHEAAAFLTPEELAVINAVEKPREFSALMATELLSAAEPHLGISQALIVGEILNKISDEGGTCVRIKFQAMPYNISIISTGFVFIWLLFLPLGLFGGVQIDPDFTAAEVVVQYVVMLVAFLFLSLLLLACDEIANQLEDPFYQLPLHEIAKNSALQMQHTPRNLRLLRELRSQEAALRLNKQEPENQTGQNDVRTTAYSVYDGPPPPPKF